MRIDQAIEPPARGEGAAGLSKRGLEHLREGLDDEIDAGRLPGAVVMVARHGNLEMVHVGGWLDKATARPMTEDALFRLFSMTKPFTSVAALMLVEQECLSLGDKVIRYLPELGEAWQGTSVLHLLLHVLQPLHCFFTSWPCTRQLSCYSCCCLALRGCCSCC